MSYQDLMGYFEIKYLVQGNGEEDEEAKKHPTRVTSN